ncbi:MAG TPA: helix-turn-helix domain-containing protein [Methanosarcinales archaeon]|nr:helix-turn-helix domain-containing protein [Methanosarcinales archaeon]
MKSPCEIVVWDVLPGIRAALAEELIKNGLSQKEVSKLLGITQSAISQYISKKRGSKIDFQDDVRDAIRGIAEDLAQDRTTDLISRICGICMMLRRDGTICGLDKCDDVDEECDTAMRIP